MIFRVITCLFMFLVPAYLAAQQPVSDTLNIKGVEVTGKRSRAENRAATPVQRLSVSELNVLSGSSAADALRNFSGVTIKDYGGLGGIKTVVVRSLGANHTGIFVDGVPLSDAASGQIDLGKIPLEDLETIELFIGNEQNVCLPARALASASLLGFHTSRPDFSVRTIKYKAGIKTGSFGVFNVNGNLYAKTGKSTALGFSAAYNNTRGNYPFVIQNGNLPDTVLKRSNADIESLNLGFNLETRFNDSSAFRVKTWFYGSERGLPGAVIFYNPWSVQRMINRDFLSNIQYTRTSGKVILLSNLTFTDGYLRYRDPAFLNNAGGLDNEYHQQEYYLSQAMSLPLGAIFSFGSAADLVVNTIRTAQYSGVKPTRVTGLGSVSLKAKTQKSEATLMLLGTMVSESSTPGQPGQPRSAVSPSFSFITRLSRSPLLRLRLMYKESFRMPTFHDLYYSLTGNTGLKPESVSQLNSGLILLKEIIALQLSLHTDVFLNRVKDKIVAVPSQNLFVWSMRNLGKVEIKGVEIQAGMLASPAKKTELSVSVNYTHQQALDLSTPGAPSYRHQIPYIPFQTLSGLLNFGGKHLSFGYNLLYSSHRYVLGENISANFLPSWWVHDFSLSWQQPVKSINWKVKAEVINLFNRHYEIIRGFPMNGRGLYITLSINH